MAQRTLLIAVLLCLTAVAVLAQARTEPAGAGPKPAMIVAGRALTPAVFAGSLTGPTVRLDGVDMLWVDAAARAAGGSAVIERTPAGKMLRISAGMNAMDFLILPPGEFWRHPWVRDLIARSSIYQLQPLPDWPYVEVNLPAHAPFGVEWKRPYLQWKPDEAWLLLNLEPPPPAEPEVMAATPAPAKAATPAPAAAMAPPAMDMGMGAPMGVPGGMEPPPMAPPPLQ